MLNNTLAKMPIWGTYKIAPEDTKPQDHVLSEADIIIGKALRADRQKQDKVQPAKRTKDTHTIG
jgi:hypothetical protein